MSDEAIGLLRFIRERAGLTPAEVHRRMVGAGVQVTYDCVWQWLAGRREPTLANLAILLRVIGASPLERLRLIEIAAASVRPAPLAA